MIQKQVVTEKSTVKSFLASQELNPELYVLIDDDNQRALNMDDELEEGMNVTLVPRIRGGT